MVSRSGGRLLATKPGRFSARLVRTVRYWERPLLTTLRVVSASGAVVVRCQLFVVRAITHH